jgi:hypothetical protein
MPIPQISIKFGGQLAKTLIKELDLEVDVWTPEVAEAVEDNRKAEMKKRGLPEVREGRADTGVHVSNQEPMPAVRISHFLSDLREAGYQLVAITAQQKPRFIGKKMLRNKFVFTVTVVFSIEEDDDPLDEEELMDLQKLVDGLATEHCHIWKNDNNDTVNLAGNLIPAQQDLRMDKKGTYGFYPAT